MGKKSNKGKQPRAAAKGNVKHQDGPLPDLPVEVIAVITEHLIGQYAFGTAASVNILSQAVHRETLPVLYESFFFENYKQLPYYQEGKRLPDALRYTKFAFLDSQNPKAECIVKKLVNVVMTVTVDSSIDKTKANEGEVRLYKPLSSLTAFRITETPLRQPLRNHELCKIQGAGWAFLELSTKQQKAFIKAQTSTECAHEQAKPPVRPVEAIRGFKLEPGAFLLPSAPTASSHFSTRLCVTDTRLEQHGEVDNENDRINTFVELLQLMGLQSHPAQLSLRERRMVMLYLLEKKGDKVCKYTRWWQMWHLGIILSRRGLEKLITKLETIIPTVPAIVKNRFCVTISDRIELEELRAYVYQMQRLYTPYVRSLDMVLPTAFAEPIATPVRIETSVQLVNPSGSTTDAGAPPKKTKWSGRVIVVAGKGSRVSLSTDFQDLALHHPV